MFQLGSISIPSPVFLAPMSGVTDAPFRSQVVKFGAPTVVTEMVASKALVNADPEFIRRSEKHNGSGPFIVQLAGRDPYWMAKGAELAAAAGADVIDINMGCPARRVTGGQSGCALMREPELARKIISAVVAVGRPVSLKMRLGWDDANLNSPDLATIAEDEGVVLVTVHARTRNQFYNGVADWRRVRPVVDAVDIPVIVNGDIVDASTAREAMAQSGAQGIMVGRAAIGRPWLLSQIASEVFGQAEVSTSLESCVQSLSKQIEDSVELYGERVGVKSCRKHVAAFVRQQLVVGGRANDGASSLCTIETAGALIAGLHEAFSDVAGFKA